MKLAVLKLLGLGFRTSGDDECDHTCCLQRCSRVFLLFGLGLFLHCPTLGSGHLVFMITALAEGSGCGWIRGTWIA